jgi:hypothetical protein
MMKSFGFGERFGRAVPGKPGVFELVPAAAAATPPPPARRARAATDDDEDHRQRDEEMRALEDPGDDTGESEDEKKARHAREARRAKADTGDDIGDGDDAGDKRDEDDPRVRGARQRERARVKAICTSAAAKKYPLLAIHVALGTDMSRRTAIAFVDQLGPLLTDDRHAPPQDLADRIVHAAAVARGERQGRPSAVAPPAGHRATAAEIVAAGKKARNEK